MDLNADFKSYQERITSCLINVTRTATQISNQDIGFHRSSSDKFSQSLDAQSAHLLRLTNKLLKAASKDTSIKAPNLQDRDDIDDKWRNVVDIVDDLLEKADRSLDEFTGVIKRLSPSRQDGSESTAKKSKQAYGVDQGSYSEMPKPQLSFEKKVENFETAPWKPLLSTKPHANMPLEDSIGSGEGGFKHPYAHEIKHMLYPNSMYRIAEPIPFSAPEESEPIFVDTPEAVWDMLEQLKAAQEIAIDLEHNDKNSYIGLVCLMQISTRQQDWIIDTLKPWREDLQILNEVFANPRIIKVLHGSTSDIVWLQRDLGLYIVGLFDTYHASNALQFPAKSLKYLLQRFAGFEAQKQYQLADWRVRPLPRELIDYARSDTHFLLYIYDHLRNMLLEASTPRDNLVEHVLDCSRREALQVYERPVYDRENGLNQGGWMRMLLQRATHLTNEQLGVFRAIHQWRDNKARELDEGEQNVMPNSLIWTFAEKMPTYRGAFFQRGTNRLPRYVAEHIPEIIEVVKQGMSQGKDGPSVTELIEKHSSRAGAMFGRNKYVRKKPEEPMRGVGATLQMLNESGELPSDRAVAQISNESSSLSTEPAISKAETSQFWGDLQLANTYPLPRSSIVAQALDDVMPLHNLLRKAFTVVEQPDKAVTPSTPAQVTNGATQIGDKENVFILREENRKRKVSEILPLEDESPNLANQRGTNSGSDSGNVSPQVPETQPQGERQSKQVRKAEKRARTEAEALARNASQANVVPFDYASAESVLHAKTDTIQSRDVNGRKAKEQPLNPFVRALDTSTGARRNKMGKELSGKSHTFRG